jgi:hypothetical protein
MLLDVQFSLRNGIFVIAGLLPFVLAGAALKSSSQAPAHIQPVTATRAPVSQTAPAQLTMIPPVAG